MLYGSSGVLTHIQFWVNFVILFSKKLNFKTIDQELWE